MRFLTLTEIDLIAGGEGPTAEEVPTIVVTAPRKMSNNIADSWSGGLYRGIGCQLFFSSLGQVSDLQRDIFCGTDYSGDNPYDPINRDRIAEIMERHAGELTTTILETTDRVLESSHF